MKRAFAVASALVLFFCACSLTQAGTPRPFNAAELDKFMVDAPHIPGINLASQMSAISEQGGEISDTEVENLQDDTRAAIKARGWDENRFNYVYSHVLGVVALENGERVSKAMAPQMAQMMQEIENNPMFDEAMKAEMRKEMGAGMGEANKDYKQARADLDKEVPKSEQKLVMSRYDELCPILGLQADPGAAFQMQGGGMMPPGQGY